jgi:hypothetical protein
MCNTQESPELESARNARCRIPLLFLDLQLFEARTIGSFTITSLFEYSSVSAMVGTLLRRGPVRATGINQYNFRGKSICEPILVGDIEGRAVAAEEVRPGDDLSLWDGE